MKVIIVILVAFIIIFTGEFLKRKFTIPTFLTRKIIHIGTSLVAFFSPLFISGGQLIIICFIFAGVLFLGRRSNIFSAIHSVERLTFGDLFLPLGVAITAFFFLPNDIKSFQFGVLIMGISDALSGLIGEKFGKHHINFLWVSKTFEGSLGFFISSLVITFIFSPVFGYHIVFIPLILTIAELCLIYGFDNLFLPILGAILINLFYF